MIIDVTPRFKLFVKGTCFKTKHDMACQPTWDVSKPWSNEGNVNLNFEQNMLPKGSVVIFVEDRQFYSPSKELHQPMSAWVRAKVVTSKGEIIWVTISCLNKSIWDYKTYTGKKEYVLEEFKRSFKMISTSLDTTEDVLIK